MLERLLLAAGLALLGLITYRGINWLLVRRRARTILGLERYEPGRPTILYFTTPGCAPCLTVQRPALQELEERYDGGLQVLQVDATEEPELADRWGVLSVPTTFLIDAQGQARGVNHGVARASKLLRQLEAIGAGPPVSEGAAEPRPRYLD